MIIETHKLKAESVKILSAVDSNELSVLTETLELKTEGNVLYMNVTNKEYYVSVKLDLVTEEEFHATVNAKVFLRLVTQITSDTIELELDNRVMVVKGNGTYKLPLIFDGDKLLELPVIDIKNKVKEFTFSGNILNSILAYNNKEFLRGVITRPVQKLCYVDEKGALTFTSGACINSFALPEPVKLLFNQRLIKLFKLFNGEEVSFTLGYDKLSEDIEQTKVSFNTPGVKLSAIISCDDTLLNAVPVNAIRSRANGEYAYTVEFEKSALLQTLNRLLLFSTMKNTSKPYGALCFNADGVTIWDVDKENREDVLYHNCQLEGGVYNATLDLSDLKAVLDNCEEPLVKLSFGDHQAFVLSRGNVKNIIPEIVLS